MNKTIKRFFSTLFILFITHGGYALPDEGMWLPMFIKRLNAEDMAKQGCKLTPEEIYSVNNSSLKDAIVWLEFCTAEIISENGLLLTNHHCAYGGIQANSSVEHNYLDNGFWAKSFSEELPVQGQTASVLVRMEDITAKVLNGITDSTAQAERDKKIKDAIKSIREEAEEKGKYRVIIRDMFNGNEYYMFVYQTFKDIRLVGAPPQNVGKFGGDTDNWMWPRHTGDFSFMRIYTAPDGSPAEYSKDNIPFKPKHVLPVSLKGYKEGDYAMILGFPGRTNRYATSSSMKMIMEKQNPVQIKLFGKKLETWKKDMDADTKTRIQYASKYARISNSWKYYIGQNEGLERLGVIDQRKKEEADFQKWADSSPENRKKFGNVISDYEKAVDGYKDLFVQNLYLNLAGRGSEIFGLIPRLKEFTEYAAKNPSNTKGIDSARTVFNKGAEEFYKDFNVNTDKNAYRELLVLYLNDFTADQLPGAIQEIGKESGSDLHARVQKYLDKLYEKSMFTNREKLNAFLAKPNMKKLEKDGFYSLNAALTTYAGAKISPAAAAYTANTEKLKRLLLEGMRKAKPEKSWYPDANSTLRMTYGNVKAYDPRDAVHFDHFTTSEGILEKYKKGDDEFDVPERLIQMLKQKDFGQYAENGVLKVAFLTTNDITGGNSGSPVLNDKGELIGCAFDGNWEAMTGDLIFDPELKRTICVDIRYVLYIVDKYAGADNLIKELKLVRN
jgi:hypothetical protein